MATPDNCPHCHVSLIGSPIPASHQEAYGGKTHFRREIGVQIRGVYDGALFYECPNCHGMWNRWPDRPDFHELHWKAEYAMAKIAKERGS